MISTLSLLLLAGSALPMQAESPSHESQDHPSRFGAVRVSKLAGMELHDAAGKQVAELTDLLVAPVGGNVCFAIVDLEGKDDTREGQVVVPFDELRVQSPMSADSKLKVALTCTPELLALAPAYVDGQENQKGWCTAITEHYADHYAAKSADSEAEGRPVYASYKPNGNPLVRSSKLMKHGVHGIATGEPTRIGEIDELVVDLDADRIAYCVVGVGGFLGMGEKNVAVPFGALTVREQVDSPSDAREWFITIPATEETFEGAPEYDADDWKSMCSPVYMDRAYSFYRVAPYWKTELERANQ